MRHYHLNIVLLRVKILPNYHIAQQQFIGYLESQGLICVIGFVNELIGILRQCQGAQTIKLSTTALFFLYSRCIPSLIMSS